MIYLSDLSLCFHLITFSQAFSIHFRFRLKIIIQLLFALLSAGYKKNAANLKPISFVNKRLIFLSRTKKVIPFLQFLGCDQKEKVIRRGNTLYALKTSFKLQLNDSNDQRAIQHQIIE